LSEDIFLKSTGRISLC